MSAEPVVHFLTVYSGGAAVGVRCSPAPKPKGRDGSYDRKQRAEAEGRRWTGWESRVTCPKCRLN